MYECILRGNSLAMTGIHDPDQTRDQWQERVIIANDPFEKLADVARMMGMAQDVPGSLERYTAVMIAREAISRGKK
jgi:hypothetical protein